MGCVCWLGVFNARKRKRRHMFGNIDFGPTNVFYRCNLGDDSIPNGRTGSTFKAYTSA